MKPHTGQQPCANEGFLTLTQMCSRGNPHPAFKCCRISEENKLFERPLGLAGERRLLHTTLQPRIDTPSTSKCCVLCKICP